MSKSKAIYETEGRKNDDGKVRFDLLPWGPLELVARVLTAGAAVYGDDNWMQVLNPERRYLSAALRHISAYQQGEDVDPETGEPHLAHASCCLLFLLHFWIQRDCEGEP